MALIGEKQPEFPPEDINAGIETMKTFFDSWLQQSGGQMMDVDVEMGDGEEGDVEADLKALRESLAKVQPQIDANPWLQSLIASF
jgi:DNA mismatch repair protein MSH2